MNHDLIKINFNEIIIINKIINNNKYLLKIEKIYLSQQSKMKVK